MGLADRDYIRKSGSGGGGFFSASGAASFPPVCKWLIIANIGVYLLQIFTESSTGMTELTGVTRWLDLSAQDLFKGQIWRLLTSAFCHGGFTHILFNMLFLGWFGNTLERGYGSREFLAFYLCGVFSASFAYVALQFYTNENFPVIGASGGVMAVTVVYAILYPRDKIYVMFVIPVEIRWLVLLYVLYDLHPVLLAIAGKNSSDGVAHAAHLGGAIFGFCYWKFGWRLEKWLPGGGRGPRRPPGEGSFLRKRGGSKAVKRPPQRRQDQEVDAILQKISDHGQASLTDRERKVLEKASERFRAREK